MLVPAEERLPGYGVIDGTGVDSVDDGGFSVETSVAQAALSAPPPPTITEFQQLPFAEDDVAVGEPWSGSSVL